MGVSHAEVGAYLLAIWGLPCPVVEAVAHHHQPRRVPQDVLDAVGVVHIANCLAHAHPVGPPLADPLAYQPLDVEYLEGLGISDQIAEWDQMAEDAAEALRGGVKEPSESKAVR